MFMVVYAEASEATNPGHMVIGQEPTGALPSYFGFRFDPADLPEGHREPEKWRDYLFSNAVRGKIVEETGYVRHLFQTHARDFYEKRAECNVALVSRLPPPESWDPHAWYSFNPDDPHLNHQPCYNCVKWAIIIANELVSEFLPSIPQGRLKRVLEHLQQRAG